MLDCPQTIEEAQAFKYNHWAGNPKDTKYQEGRCAYEVWGNFCVSYQCSRKNGHGINGLYCKQHAKMVEAK